MALRATDTSFDLEGKKNVPKIDGTNWVKYFVSNFEDN